MDDLQDLQAEYRSSIAKIQRRYDELLKTLPTLRGEEYIQARHRLDALQDNIMNLSYGIWGMLRSTAGVSDFPSGTVQEENEKF